METVLEVYSQPSFAPLVFSTSLGKEATIFHSHLTNLLAVCHKTVRPLPAVSYRYVAIATALNYI